MLSTWILAPASDLGACLEGPSEAKDPGFKRRHFAIFARRVHSGSVSRSDEASAETADYTGLELHGTGHA